MAFEFQHLDQSIRGRRHRGGRGDGEMKGWVAVESLCIFGTSKTAYSIFKFLTLVAAGWVVGV